ncbi:hemolysin A isoform X2 [Phoenix dactylifera]|uniref:Hemolysin A isoform X2 n=1 Tax=Phoenix dactylifera TaxID=42345 RepID=A0A8B9AS08_PHODC|nr:hemolysin A isoform X2 [Phoenix dactylifera]
MAPSVLLYRSSATHFLFSSIKSGFYRRFQRAILFLSSPSIPFFPFIWCWVTLLRYFAPAVCLLQLSQRFHWFSFSLTWGVWQSPSCHVRCYAVAKAGKVQLPKKRRRLDEVCLERFQQYSRTFIQSWIIQGKVFVDGRVVNKAGTPVSEKSIVEIKAEVPKYVCRAGYKLEAAIEQFGVDVVGKVALDSGLSTGGFTDCLLQHGASYVYGVDVGYGQVMPAVVDVMKMESTLLTLVKPQFEARRSQVGGGGIVRDPLVHQEVLERIIKGVEDFGFCAKGWMESPIKGAEGNTEFLVCFQRISKETA